MSQGRLKEHEWAEMSSNQPKWAKITAYGQVSLYKPIWAHMILNEHELIPKKLKKLNELKSSKTKWAQKSLTELKWALISLNESKCAQMCSGFNKIFPVMDINVRHDICYGF